MPTSPYSTGRSLRADSQAGIPQGLLLACSGWPRLTAAAPLLLRFHSMLPFLDGTHHLDEILYRAGLSRKAVRGVLADFDSFLVSFVN